MGMFRKLLARKKIVAEEWEYERKFYEYEIDFSAISTVLQNMGEDIELTLRGVDGRIYHCYGSQVIAISRIH